MFINVPMIHQQFLCSRFYFKKIFVIMTSNRDQMSFSFKFMWSLLLILNMIMLAAHKLKVYFIIFPTIRFCVSEYGRSRDSDSESSGSPCAACAAELYRLPAAHLSGEYRSAASPVSV